MVKDILLEDFRKKVCESIDLYSEGVDRFLVRTPFTFDDGDALKVVLKKSSKGWCLTDEGHTYMHLSYKDINLDTKGRRQVVDKIIATQGIIDREGELIMTIRDERYGDSLFTYLQALTKMTDLAYLSRERVKTLFMEEFRGFLVETIPEEELVFDHVERSVDKDGHYTVDVMIKTPTTPVFVFAIRNDTRCRDATISLLYLENKGLRFKSVGVFENQEDIARPVLARFTNVCERQFSTLQGMKERFPRYLEALA